MPNTQEPSINTLRRGSIIVTFISCTLAIVLTSAMYLYTKNLLNKRLDARLEAIVSTASLLFSGDKIEHLLDLEVEERIKTQDYRNLIFTLRKIKQANNDVTFAYLFESTNNPLIMKFIADADVIALQPQLNFNENEVTTEGFPGSEYDVSGIEAIQTKKAFEIATTSPEIYEDYWGSLYSAYAPIRNSAGEMVALLVIDVNISDYNRLIKSTFLPFGLVTIVLLATLAGLAFGLLNLWGKRVDLLRELDRQKDELLGIVSHQLATPISALKWDFEMLLDGDIGEITGEQKDFFQKLQGVTTHLSDLVSMILDVSRIQLGRMKVDRTDLQLNTFFDELLNIMAAKAKERNVDLVSSVPQGLGIGQLDKRLMLMITENLLSNAIKYTPEKGKVKLDVKVENKALKIVVSDTGCGIPKQDQDKIFGKLYRASNVRSVDGNGFGLYVVKGASEAQGGKIWFASEENKGTSFYVELPLLKN